MPDPLKTEFGAPAPAVTPPAGSSRRQAFYAQWAMVSVFWVLIAMASLLEASWYDPFGVAYNWRPVAVQWLPWILLTPLVMWLTSAFTLERSTWYRNLWVHVLACILIVGGLGTLSYMEAQEAVRSAFSGYAGSSQWNTRFAWNGSNAPPWATNMGPRGAGMGGMPGTDFGGGEFSSRPNGWGTNRYGQGSFGGPPPGGSRGPGGAPPAWGTNLPSFMEGLTRQFGGNPPFAGMGGFRMPFYMPPPMQVILLNATIQLPTFWAVLGLAHALLFYGRAKDRERRGAELEGRLNQARLQALRMQINPHFLFNTLNSISSLVYDKPRVADEMIGSLSDLLRVTLNTSHRQEVTLREELEFLDQYLFIEQTRFGDRLTIEKDIDPAAVDAVVPNLILQPLVENAFKYGIESRLGPGVITISAKRDGDRLLLEVTDNGRGAATSGEGKLQEGVGLSNTRARLRGLYGDRASLSFGPRPEGGFRVTLQIPWKTPHDASPATTSGNS